MIAKSCAVVILENMKFGEIDPKFPQTVQYARKISQLTIRLHSIYKVFGEFSSLFSDENDILNPLLVNFIGTPNTPEAPQDKPIQCP